VRDEQGQRRVGEPQAGRPRSTSLSKRLPFAFTDWTLGVHAARRDVGGWGEDRILFQRRLSQRYCWSAPWPPGGFSVCARANGPCSCPSLKIDFVPTCRTSCRTPVASIRVCAEHLKGGRVNDPAKIREYGDFIENREPPIVRLIDNILDFSRESNRGRKTYRFAPARSTTIVTATVRTFDARLRSAGIHDRLHAAWQARSSRARRGRDAQTLHNLSSTIAVKYFRRRALDRREAPSPG
jgi:hypothetical protein